MPANSKPIVLDVNGKPAPQYYNPTTDAYEYLHGEAGAMRVLLWGPGGQALLVQTPTGETKQVLGVAGYGHDGTSWRPLKTTATGQVEADVIDRAARVLGKVTADDGAIAALGALADAAKTDTALSASVIALLKGLLQTLRTDAAKVQVSASFDTLRNMVGATKTATSVASEVFAGASRLTGRRGVIIKNEHPYLRIRVDGGAVTHKTGVALEPFWAALFALDPAVDVPIYVISEAGMAPYGVVEF